MAGRHSAGSDTDHYHDTLRGTFTNIRVSSGRTNAHLRIFWLMQVYVCVYFHYVHAHSRADEVLRKHVHARAHTRARHKSSAIVLGESRPKWARGENRNRKNIAIVTVSSREKGQSEIGREGCCGRHFQSCVEAEAGGGEGEPQREEAEEPQGRPGRRSGRRGALLASTWGISGLAPCRSAAITPYYRFMYSRAFRFY